MSLVLQLENVSKSFAGISVLGPVDLALPEDAYVTLLGPSGSGKTTLLRMIAGFEQPDQGTIVFSGNRVDRVAPHERGIGFVFQNFALFPHLSVEQNIAFGLENRRQSPIKDARAVKSKVRDIIALVGLSGLESRAVTQISGGQKQRVALARTLVAEPKMVLLDEPLGALDANLRVRMRSELRAIRERCGVTFLHVTGSETEALTMGDSVLILDGQKIAQQADPDTVYNRPISPAVARLFNSYNLLPGRLDSGRFVTPAGTFEVTRAPVKSPEAAYAIRYDRVAARIAGAAATAGEISIEATFVASEYTGATINSFFLLGNGAIFEVETHLSHAAPVAFQPHGRYSLAWKKEDAIVYA